MTVAVQVAIAVALNFSVLAFWYSMRGGRKERIEISLTVETDEERQRIYTTYRAVVTRAFLDVLVRKLSRARGAEAMGPPQTNVNLT
jgi:hypothetical protein